MSEQRLVVEMIDGCNNDLDDGMQWNLRMA